MTKKREALDKAKQSWKKLLKWWKELWKWTYHVVKWISKTLWHTIKGGYHLIDAWDKAIWEKIEKKQIEKWKKVWKVSNFLRDNMIKLAMVLSLAGYWWYKTHNYYGEKNNKEKQEIVIEEKTGLSFEEKERLFDRLESVERWTGRRRSLMASVRSSVPVAGFVPVASSEGD